MNPILIAVLWLISATFITLKLCGVMSASWWLCLSPLLVWIGLSVIAGIAIAYQQEKHARKWRAK